MGESFLFFQSSEKLQKMLLLPIHVLKLLTSSSGFHYTPQRIISFNFHWKNPICLPTAFLCSVFKLHESFEGFIDSFTTT